MSRHRHKARGGGTKEVWEAGEKTNAAKEAEDKEEGSRGLKKGGRAHHRGEGEAPKRGAHKRARGGHVMHHHEHAEEKHHHAVKGHSMHHTEHHHGSHAVGRKRGGGVGANRTPLSTAANIKEVVKGEYGEDEAKSD